MVLKLETAAVPLLFFTIISTALYFAELLIYSGHIVLRLVHHVIQKASSLAWLNIKFTLFGQMADLYKVFQFLPHICEAK